MVHASCLTAGMPQGMGDFPELSVETTSAAARTAAWRVPFRPGACEAWLGASEQVFLVLVYAPPGWALLPESADAAGASAAVDEWLACNSELLGVAGRYPDRCVLVHAHAAIHAPAELVARIGECLSLTLRWPAEASPPDRDVHTALAVSVAQGALLRHRPALSLYRELESAAALDGDAFGTVQCEYQAARVELANLRRDARSRLDVERMRVEFDAQTAVHKEAFATYAHQLGDLTAQRDSEVSRVSQLVEQCRVAEESADHHARELERWRSRAETLETALAAALEEARLHQEAAVLAPEVNNAIAIRANLEEMNELLSLQLHQMQEELELFYGQNKKLSREIQQAVRGEQLIRRWWQINHPPDVIVDLRQDIEGGNWYGADADGRWFGPATYGTLLLPALRPGIYSIQLDIVGAAGPGMLEGLTLSLNGTGFEVGIDAQDFPCFVIGVAVGDASDGGSWTLGIRLPHTSSPPGGGDTRLLGIRVRSAIFTLLESE